MNLHETDPKMVFSNESLSSSNNSMKRTLPKSSSFRERSVLGESTGQYLNTTFDSHSSSFKGKLEINLGFGDSSKTLNSFGSFCDNTSEAGSLRSKSSRMSAKQQLVTLQKAESARKIREEKLRLREEKSKLQEEFLKRSAERRELNEQLSEVRRQAFKHEQNTQLAAKEMEIIDRRWMLEQERLHRIDLECDRRAERIQESETKQKERECIIAAENREKERKAAARRAERLLQYEEIEHRRMLKEMERMEKEKEQGRDGQVRAERKHREEEEQRRALEEAQTSRALDSAAYQDVQEYLRSESKKRRESIASRLKEESDWKKRQNHQKKVDRYLAAKERQVEILAYNDMKRYLASEKDKRRQSLAEYLQQESEFRKIQEVKKDRQRQLELQNRALEDAARRDMEAYLASEKERRRQSIASRLEMKSHSDVEQALRDLASRDKENENRRLDALAHQDPAKHAEYERENQMRFILEQTQRQRDAARRVEEKTEAELRRFQEMKRQDLVDYSNSISQKHFLSSQSQNDFGRIEEEEDIELELEKQHCASGDANEVNTTKESISREGTCSPILEQENTAVRGIPISDAAATKPTSQSRRLYRPSALPRAGGCCIIS